MLCAGFLQVVELGKENQQLKATAAAVSICSVELAEQLSRSPVRKAACWALFLCHALQLQMPLLSVCLQATTAEEKLRQIQDCNKQAVKENCK
jgi:uncharacterized membrane protein